MEQEAREKEIFDLEKEITGINISMEKLEAIGKMLCVIDDDFFTTEQSDAIYYDFGEVILKAHEEINGFMAKAGQWEMETRREIEALQKELKEASIPRPYREAEKSTSRILMKWADSFSEVRKELDQAIKGHNGADPAEYTERELLEMEVMQAIWIDPNNIYHDTLMGIISDHVKTKAAIDKRAEENGKKAPGTEALSRVRPGADSSSFPPAEGHNGKGESKMKGGDDMDQDLSRCAKCGKEFFPDEDDGSGDFPILRIAEERMVKNKKTGEVYCWECGQVLMKVKEMATK